MLCICDGCDIQPKKSTVEKSEGGHLMLSGELLSQQQDS